MVLLCTKHDSIDLPAVSRLANNIPKSRIMESMAGLLPARCDTAMLYQGNSNTWNKLQIRERERLLLCLPNSTPYLPFYRGKEALHHLRRQSPVNWDIIKKD